jgi:hypothetical protein
MLQYKIKTSVLQKLKVFYEWHIPQPIYSFSVSESYRNMLHKHRNGIAIVEIIMEL